MQIGKKFYYENDTGNIIREISEREGDVRETTLEEDFPEGVPENTSFIQLNYKEFAEEFNNMASMKIIDEQLVIYQRLTILADKSQIIADGIDTAIISSDYAESFSVDGGENYAVNPLMFSSTVPGVYTIIANSTLHGQNSLIVEVI